MCDYILLYFYTVITHLHNINNIVVFLTGIQKTTIGMKLYELYECTCSLLDLSCFIIFIQSFYTNVFKKYCFTSFFDIYVINFYL